MILNVIIKQNALNSHFIHFEILIKLLLSKSAQCALLNIYCTIINRNKIVNLIVLLIIIQQVFLNIHYFIK